MLDHPIVVKYGTIRILKMCRVLYMLVRDMKLLCVKVTAHANLQSTCRPVLFSLSFFRGLLKTHYTICFCTCIPMVREVLRLPADYLGLANRRDRMSPLSLVLLLASQVEALLVANVLGGECYCTRQRARHTVMAALLITPR